MQENQVTIEGTTLPLPRPFMVLATQNPIEQEGVYRLPEAQLDRFLLRVDMGYPGHGHEVAMLRLHSGVVPEAAPLSRPNRSWTFNGKWPAVHGNDALLDYIVDLAEASRKHPDIALAPARGGRCACCAAPAPALFWMAGTISRMRTCRPWPTASWAIA